MYQVILVDDESLIRDAISKNMKWEDLGYQLAGTCKNGSHRIFKRAYHRPCNN